MKIDKVVVRRLHVPLKAAFETSFGRFTYRDCILVEVQSDGVSGWAECIAMPTPFYNEETVGTALHVLKEFLIPQVLGKDIHRPDEVADIFLPVRRNYMAISGLESAVWDTWSRQQGISLARALGQTQTTIASGVSIGIEASVEAVLQNVRKFVDQGYKKVKVKIKPGFDVKLIAAIREEFGEDLPLMADANSAYTLADISVFKELDKYGLMMIEQPLAHDDIVEHADLQKELGTPICLDESILSREDAQLAIRLGSCRIINLKIGRVGGLTRTRQIHDICLDAEIPVWCGGMFEMGVGRAHNLAISSLPGFSIVGDVSPPNRHFAEDIITPALDFSEPGILKVPDAPGFGFEVHLDAVRKFTKAEEVYS